MFSLNVPLPPAVERLAADLHPKLTGFDRVRERYTLVGKRFGVDDVGEAGRTHRSKDAAVATLRADLRPLLAGTGPFDVSVTAVATFETPAQGPAPVVYLAVESDVLVRLHRRLCAAFDPVDGIEGDDYVPHITLARGGGSKAVDALSDVDIDPIEWRVHELALYDPEFREVADRIEL
ncbi:2'-5' RNA ligase family protein [Halorubrum sp. DTA98]|uniref:2'-5' RNA ligase family protein n=1 Tax=Halorubrum sp. DTA98 TaxID=3402163 RepID=UPI003AAD9A13